MSINGARRPQPGGCFYAEDGWAVAPLANALRTALARLLDPTGGSPQGEGLRPR